MLAPWHNSTYDPPRNRGSSGTLPDLEEFGGIDPGAGRIGRFIVFGGGALLDVRSG